MTQTISKYNRKIFSLFLALIMTFSCFSLSASAKSQNFYELESSLTFMDKVSRTFLNTWNTIIKKDDLKPTKLSITNLDISPEGVEGLIINFSAVVFQIKIEAQTLAGRKKINPDSVQVYCLNPDGEITIRPTTKMTSNERFCQFVCLKSGTYEVKVVINNGELVAQKKFTIKEIKLN